MLLYIEEQILNHERTKKICSFFPYAEIIVIYHYKNIFDKNFPTKKSVGFKDVLVIAKLTGSAISKAPDGYGHSQEGWFFKTTLNCVFDCQYCYLKGAFKNDFPVIFVNYEEIGSQITKSYTSGILSYKGEEKMRRYMSDRSDTQGFDSILHTHEYFFQLFDSLEGAMCETRTKASNISTLIDYHAKYGAPQSIEIAYSLNPQSLIDAFETGTASLDRRIQNINILLDLGYKVGLRFMPLLPVENYMEVYADFLLDVTHRIDLSRIYSSFAGGLLYTKDDYKKIARKEPGFQSILNELSDAGDGYYREKLDVRQNLYDLFKKYVSNCFVCLDEYK